MLRVWVVVVCEWVVYVWGGLCRYGVCVCVGGVGKVCVLQNGVYTRGCMVRQ